MTDTNSGAPRNDAIDALRGVAILSVLTYHYTVRFPPHVYLTSTAWPSWLRLGALGVEVFFVVSGLVITMTILRCRTVIDFAQRRFARLFPAMLVAATLTTVLSALGPPEFRVGLSNWLASLTFLPSTLGIPGADGVYWTLDVEVRFYAVAALSFLLLRNNFWIGVISAAIICSIASLLNSALTGPLLAAFWPYFLLGMAAWYGLFEGRKRLGMLHAVVGLTLFMTKFPGFLETTFIVASLTAGYAIHRYNLPATILSRVGLWSYPLYLLHQKIGIIGIRWLKVAHMPDLVAIALTITAMVIASAVMHRCVELPGKSICNRLFSLLRAQQHTRLASTSG